MKREVHHLPKMRECCHLKLMRDFPFLQRAYIISDDRQKSVQFCLDIKNTEPIHVHASEFDWAEMKGFLTIQGVSVQ